MLLLIKTLMAFTCAVFVGFLLSAPEIADPSEHPCQLAVTFLCRFVPIAPELDGDIDLTKQQPPADPAAPAPDTLPPVDVCANGCA